MRHQHRPCNVKTVTGMFWLRHDLWGRCGVCDPLLPQVLDGVWSNHSPVLVLWSVQRKASLWLDLPKSLSTLDLSSYSLFPDSLRGGTRVAFVFVFGVNLAEECQPTLQSTSMWVWPQKTWAVLPFRKLLAWNGGITSVNISEALMFIKAAPILVS